MLQEMNNNSGNKLKANVNVRRVRWWINAITKVTRGVVSNLSRGELNFFHIGGGGTAPLGAKKP